MDISSKWTSLKARAHALAVAYADFRPQHVRRRLPLRLARYAEHWFQTLSPVQVKDLVWNKYDIALGAKQLSGSAPLLANSCARCLSKALTVLTHAFLPQLTYEGDLLVSLVQAKPRVDIHP